jgi:hypothetical protein
MPFPTNISSPLAAFALCAFGLLALPSRAEMRPYVAAPKLVPEQNANAFWVDSTVCSVVLKTSIDALKPIQQGATPLDTLTAQPATCSSNITGQTMQAAGIRALLAAGFRVNSVSHAVTPLHSSTDARVELLLSIVFALERPQTASTVVMPGSAVH